MNPTDTLIQQLTEQIQLQQALEARRQQIEQSIQATTTAFKDALRNHGDIKSLSDITNASLQQFNTHCFERISKLTDSELMRETLKNILYYRQLQTREIADEPSLDQ